MGCIFPYNLQTMWPFSENFNPLSLYMIFTILLTLCNAEQKNRLLIKLFCFSSDFDETWWSCSYPCVLQFHQISPKLDEKQKSFINSPFFCSVFQSVSRIVKIVHSGDSPGGGFRKSHFFPILVHCAAAELLRWGKLKTFLQTDLMLMSTEPSVKCEDKSRKRIWDVGSGTEKISTPIFSHTIASFIAEPPFHNNVVYKLGHSSVPFGTGGTMALLCDDSTKNTLYYLYVLYVVASDGSGFWVPSSG